MLAVLDVRPYARGGLRKKLRCWRKKSGPVASEVRSLGSSRYLLIRAEKDTKERLDWNRIRTLAGREAGRMLLPAKPEPPKELGIGPFHGTALRKALMVEAAVAVLQKLPAIAGQRTVGIFDPSASRVSLAERLLPYAADVRVVTAKPEAYEQETARLLETYGAAVTVTTRQEVLSTCTIVLAPEGTNGLKKIGRGLYFSGKPETRRRVVSGYTPSLTFTQLQGVPQHCDLCGFFEGLYELSGCTELGTKPPALLLMNGENIPLRDACWQLAGIDIGISV